ncbi:N-acetylneuraminate synthase family protein [Desulfocurvus sp. DL9XJH121]
MNTHFPVIRLRGGREIGPGRPCFLVAEIGNNHQGDEATARQMIKRAAQAGADAVKFQKRDTRALLTRAGRRAPYAGPNSFGATYGQHRDALELPLAAMARLKEYAEALGLVFFASAWDLPSLRGMADLGLELLKIASADLTNLPLLRAARATGLPILISTGMSTLADVEAALAVLRPLGARLILLHCNSTYPCPDRDVALPAMNELARRFGLPVGYSGHERGIAPSLGAVALGACVVERHFTLDRTWPGTDHAASLTPEEFADLAAMAREMEAALAGRAKRVTPGEAACAAKLRKSIVAARPLPAGTVLAEADLTVKSPGTGICPLRWDEVLGRTLLRALDEDEMLAPGDLAGDEAPAESGKAAAGGAS